MIMQAEIDATKVMNKEMTDQVDVEYKFWEIICRSYAKRSLTYVGTMKKTCVQNLHHGKLNTSGLYHGIWSIVMSAITIS